MEIEIPSGGCFVAGSATSFTHYLNGQRTTYYLNENQLIRGSSTSSSNVPSGVYCLQQGDLVYKPELEIYYQFMSLILIGAALVLIWDLIIKNLWRGR